MRIVDPGHVYALPSYDGGEPVLLTFVKREGEGYPYNEGHHPGTLMQDVIRALLDRLVYLDGQIPAPENADARAGLLSALFWLETRAHRVRGETLGIPPEYVERLPGCPTCGHVLCKKHPAP